MLLKGAALLVVIAAFTAIALWSGTPSVDQLRQLVDRAGWWGPAGFSLGYAALTLAPVPKNMLSIAAGVLFGFGPGLLMVYLGALLGAAGAFWLGRWLGRSAVERFTGTRVARVDEILQGHGFATMAGVRLIPVLPFTVINYSAGLTSVGWWPFAAGTAVGMIPGTASVVALGAYGFEAGIEAQLALAVLGLLTIAAAVFAYRRRKRSEPASA
ncbi:TVP38/TMEM64 family protein [Nesterenkonia sphaerica]|uniref:TVP38/TMEM64 family membrane protein n=1 Tax=Nesterenkonia sphaerica TaxID=1804988 RepID=A0A5R9APP8_9MICC|nr:TVP38/TMEM64 family protein [Nesterenkonia sphaerica]TLP79826.1 TVP38/TMEM64 family protein [Nesterenkonia sphaerica]